MSTAITTRMSVLLLGAIIVLFSAVSALAQGDTASISGRVTDQSGAVIVGAEVEVRNIDTNAVVTRTTDNEGLYVIAALRPGRYSVIVRKQGFQTVTLKDITLNVLDKISRNFTLRVGSPTESIVVIAEATNINTTSGAVGTVVDRNFVNNLPMNGRSFQALIMLTPSMVITDTSASTPGSFSVNGQRGNANYFTVDGVSANLFANQGYSMNGSGPGLSSIGGTNNLISMDALEEFKIQTSSYSSEFGRQPGAQVSLVTRSGKNKFGGTIFQSFRNEALEAREFFNRTCTTAGVCTAAKKPPLRQNHFGGTFGGPVLIPGLYDGHNRTFFFFSYEDQRLRLPSSGTAWVPSLSLRQTAAANLQPLFKAFPSPNGSGVIGTYWTEYYYSLSDPLTMKATSLRMDHTFSSKLTVFARYNYSPSESMTHGATYLTTPYSSASLTRTLTMGATSAITPPADQRLENQCQPYPHPDDLQE